MRSIGEFFELLYLRLKVALYNGWQQIWLKRKFSLFKKIDKEILSSPNPYKIPKAFPYGETPFSTLKQIADRWHITPSDHILELGCGRGRGTFFLAYYTAATVKGVDWTPSFISHAKAVGSKHRELKVSFSCEDFHKTDLSCATVIYLYGTCLSPSSVKILSSQFQKLPTSVKIITISEPIMPQLKIEDQFIGSFPWGKTEIYLQIT